MNMVRTKVMLNIGYMVSNLELENEIVEIDNDDLAHFIENTIDEFLIYDKDNVTTDFYQNMEDFYVDDLIKLGNEK